MPSNDKVNTITREFIEEVCRSLQEGRPVRRHLQCNGRLHIERQLPFLCIYRSPVGTPDPETERLVVSEAAYVIVSTRSSQKGRMASLVERIVESMVQEFGAFLLLEIWAGPEVQEDERKDPEAVRPVFCIHADGFENESMQSVLESLETNLERIRVHHKSAEVRVRYARKTTPPGMPALISGPRRQSLNCFAVGLEVQPIYRNPERGDDFPIVLRTLRRGVSRALRRTFFEFTRKETTHRPRHYHSLGQRAMTRAVWEVDRRLSEIDSAFDFLLQVTPINIVSGWSVFKRRGFERPPTFHYRPMSVNPAELKRKLYSIVLNHIEDPTLETLFREERDDLDRRLTMLNDRNTPRFLYGSLQLFGPVDEPLLQTALGILEQLPGRTRDEISSGPIGAHQFAERARVEILNLQKSFPEMAARVTVTEEVAGLMVSKGNLLVGASLRVPAARVEALIQHEIGTHVLTYWNARAQKFRLLASGLAGYDELQEGLAVLSEHLVGGLSASRLRLLAGRVVAAHCLQEGASFVETFLRLHGNHDFERRTAYVITSRIYRGGGLTKDAVYLRGLVQLLNFLADGGDLETLFVGKLARHHVPIIRELRLRNVIGPPKLRPTYLHLPEVTRRLKKLSKGMSPVELVNQKHRRH